MDLPLSSARIGKLESFFIVSFIRFSAATSASSFTSLSEVNIKLFNVSFLFRSKLPAAFAAFFAVASSCSKLISFIGSLNDELLS